METENAIIDTVLSNPDRDDFAGVPDGMHGLATISRQKITTGIDSSGATAYSTYDVYIVRMGFEWVSGSSPSVPNADFFSDTDPTQYIENLVQPINDATGDTWSGAGFPNGVEIGGLIAYVMRPGYSPFSSSDPSIIGPTTPLKVIRLDYDESVLHGLTQVLESNWEVIDNTATLDQQGTVTQAGWNSPGQMPNFKMFRDNKTVPYGYGSMSVWEVNGYPGCTRDLLKSNASTRVGAAKEGTFVHDVVDLLHNEPHAGEGVNMLFRCGNSNGIVDVQGKNIFMFLGRTAVINAAGPPYAGFWASGASGGQGKMYKTAVQPNMTIIRGLKDTFTLSLTRTIVTRNFILPTSPFAPFAKMQSIARDPAFLVALQSASEQVQQFWPSASNANGKFFRAAKKLWKKASPIVKAVAPVGMRALGVNPGILSTGKEISKMTEEFSRMMEKGKELNNKGKLIEKVIAESSKMASKKKKKAKKANKQ